MCVCVLVRVSVWGELCTNRSFLEGEGLGTLEVRERSSFKPRTLPCKVESRVV